MKFTQRNFTYSIYTDDGKHIATLECTGQCTLREAGDIERALRQVMTDATPKRDLSGASALNDKLNQYASEVTA